MMRPGGPRRALEHPVWLHPEVSDDLRQKDPLYRRLGLILSHLAAAGRTTIVKSCKGQENRGWLRSPLGGNNGFQYYLWWTHHGSPQSDGIDTPEGTILVRAVRQHDDHAHLRAGAPDDYIALESGDDLVEVSGRFWTEEQEEFAAATEAVRMLAGRPGSGKTTALWRAVDVRRGEKVLYVTWSEALARQAGAHFRSFGADDMVIEATGYTDLLRTLSAEEIPDASADNGRRGFLRAIERFGTDVLGPWEGHREALYAEIRAHLLGSSWPRSRNDDWENIERDTETYRTRRCGPSEGVGSRACRAVVKTVRKLGPKRAGLIFPELHAAAEAARRIATAGPPTPYDDIDRIVVDEAQDLTTAEIGVLTTLCRETGRRRGRRPRLLLAADEGQTVRPTGFGWARTGELVARDIGRAKVHQLSRNVRCPARIAAAIEGAGSEYARVTKSARPRKQHGIQADQHTEAHIMRVRVDGSSGAGLVAELAKNNRVGIVTPRDEPPGWVRPENRAAVLTPESAKGLEFEIVCVLEAATVLQELDTAASRQGEDRQAAGEHARGLVDRLRVCISRATETLVYVDTADGRKGGEADEAMFGQAAHYTPDDLVRHTREDAATAEERVLGRIRVAEELVQTAPLRAWELTRQAIDLLGPADVPEGVGNPAVRTQTADAVFRTIGEILFRPDCEDAAGLGIGTGAARVARLCAAPDDDASPEAARLRSMSDAVARLIACEKGAPGGRKDAADDPVALAGSLAKLRDAGAAACDWVEPAVRRIRARLVESVIEAARDPDRAGAFRLDKASSWAAGIATGRVPADRTARSEDAETLGAQWCRTALDTLIAAGREASREGRVQERKRRGTAAGALVESLGNAATTAEQAAVAELVDDLETAERLYLEEGLQERIVRMWRDRAKWEKALEHAEGDERAEIEWLLGIDRLSRTIPEGELRLRPAEVTKLRDALESIDLES